MSITENRRQSSENPDSGPWLAFGLFIASLLLLIFRDHIGKQVIYRELLEDSSGLLRLILNISIAGMLAGFLLGWPVFWWALIKVGATAPGRYMTETLSSVGKRLWLSISAPINHLARGLASAGSYIWLAVATSLRYLGKGLAFLGYYLWLGISTPFIYLGRGLAWVLRYLWLGVSIPLVYLGRGLAWIGTHIWLAVSTSLRYLGRGLAFLGQYLWLGISTPFIYLGRGLAWVGYHLWLGISIPFIYLGRGLAWVLGYLWLGVSIFFAYLRKGLAWVGQYLHLAISAFFSHMGRGLVWVAGYLRLGAFILFGYVSRGIVYLRDHIWPSVSARSVELGQKLAIAGKRFWLAVSAYSRYLGQWLARAGSYLGQGLAWVGRVLWLGIATPFIYLSRGVVRVGNYLWEAASTLLRYLGRGLVFIGSYLWLGISTPFIYLGRGLTFVGGYLWLGIAALFRYLGRGLILVGGYVWLGVVIASSYLWRGLAWVIGHLWTGLSILLNYLIRGLAWMSGYLKLGLLAISRYIRQGLAATEGPRQAAIRVATRVGLIAYRHISQVTKALLTVLSAGTAAFAQGLGKILVALRLSNVGPTEAKRRNIVVYSGLGVLLVGIIIVTGWQSIILFLIGVDTSTLRPPPNAIEISIIYAPEEELYLIDAIDQFNRAYIDGLDPLTNQPMADSERPIFVKGESGSSGRVAQGVINAIIAPNNINVARPTIYSPSVSHWLALVNYQTGQEIFDLADSPPTALAPVVIAIWESRLKAIQEKSGSVEIGWEELLAILHAPNGWADYNIPGDRTTVYYGHTDPFVSSTALSTLIAEFYASARAVSGQPNLNRLTLEHVNDPDVQQGVRNIEDLIRHYSSRTTEFKEYIAQGPDYLDFVALEENDLIYINQGKTDYQPPEKLVALYPKEGTFWHEHPFAVPQADWVTNEQREAAKVFTQFVRSEAIQTKILESGFRPINPSVTIGYPITPDLGVDPNQPAAVLELPDSDVVAAVQSSWRLVKKQADVLLVVDTSGSMLDEKIAQAREAANVFLDNMPPQNRVGLVSFDSKVEVLTSLDSFEDNQFEIRNQVNGLDVGGGTALFDAIQQSIEVLKTSADEEGNRIQAVVVLGDGQDTDSQASLQQVVELISASIEDRNPIIVVPIAYGDDADTQALTDIARASATRVQSGDPENIQRVLEIISSYF